MKHTWPITLLLVGLFLLAQYIGLFVSQHYAIASLPFGIQRPDIEPRTSFIPLFGFILLATLLALLFIRFNLAWLWKLWFFLSVVFTVMLSLAVWLPGDLAIGFALVLALFKVVQRSIILHNLTEVFIYGGLAAIFVPILSVFSMGILLILISIYDYIAVRKTKHMVALAKFQTKLRTFAGLMIPYQKEIALLGGGDIGFPLLFAGVVVAEMGLKGFVLPLFSAAALFILFLLSKKQRFYPAMPFLAAGCFLGYGVLLVTG